MLRDYDYKVPAIEEFFEEIRKKLYTEAMEILPKIYEDSKTLDFADYSPKTFDHDRRAVTNMKDKLDSLVYHEQMNAFRQYQEEMMNCRETILKHETHLYDICMVSDDFYKRIFESENKPEEEKKCAKRLYDLSKLRTKSDKEIKASHKEEYNRISALRNELNLRKQLIKLQKEMFKKFTGKYGKEVLKFDLQNLALNGIDDEAERYSKIAADGLKYDLYRRTEEYVGKLVDMDFIYIAGNGSLNGIVTGETGKKAKVETIMAGGYNIQCLHYRVLIKPLK